MVSFSTFLQVTVVAERPAVTSMLWFLALQQLARHSSRHQCTSRAANITPIFHCCRYYVQQFAQDAWEHVHASKFHMSRAFICHYLLCLYVYA
jgi:hypothetical protein